MRILFSIALTLLTLQAQAGATHNQCVSFYSSRSLIPVPWLVIQELALLHFEISQMPAGEDKLLALNEFKRKLAEVRKTYGEQVIAKVKAAIEAESQQLADKKEKEVKQQETELKKETDSVLKWTRIRTHDKAKVNGPFLNETEMFTDKDGNLALYDYKNNEYTMDADISDGDRSFRVTGDTELLLTPSKQHLVVVQNKGVDVIDFKTNQGKRLPLNTQHARGFRGAKLSRDGQHLFLAGEDGETFIFTVPELKPVFMRTTNDYPHGNMIVESPNGQYVFFIRHDGLQVLYDLVNNVEIKFPDLKAASVYHISDAVFSLDSKTITFLNHNKTISDFDIATRQIVPTRLAVKRAEYLKISKDDKIIVAITNHGVVERNNENPYRVINNASGVDITPDLPSFNMQNPSNFRLAGKDGHLLIGEGTSGEWAFRDGKNQPTEAYIYALDLNTMKFIQYPLTPARYLMHIYGTTPDGETILARGNGGPLLEVY